MSVSERALRERRAFLDEYEAEERAKEEQRLAPMRAAEREFNNNARKLQTIERENVLKSVDETVTNSKGEVVSAVLSTAMQVAPWPGDEAARTFNIAEAQKFIAQTPEYYECSENGNAIAAYTTRNGIKLIDADTYRNIFRRLHSLGLMKQKPEPEPEAVPPIEPPAPVPPEPEELAGIDPATGLRRVYTRTEVEQMPADVYRRAFRLPSAWQQEYEGSGAGKWPVKESK